MSVLSVVRRRWLCLVLLAVTVVDLVVADPLPFLDETVLAGLTAACFGRHRKARADDARRAER